MSYYTGSMVAVPTANKQQYIEHTTAAWLVFKGYGALRIVEAWGVDIPRGKVNDLYGAVDAREDESVVFSWIQWPDKATADAAWQRMQGDEAMAQLPPMPFDGRRMIHGDFESVFTAGSAAPVQYLQGFVLAVPQQNKAAYIDLAKLAWDSMFAPQGCRGVVEAWGVDVPRGQHTDFYRATQAQDDEVPVFSWMLWADRASCDAAAQAMEADMQGKEHPPMPFDGMRMMWGGFEVIFDSATSA